MLKVENTHAVALFPCAGTRGADADDGAGGLVGGDHGEGGGELALYDLEVGVAEAGGVDADEELIVVDGGDGGLVGSVGFVVLVSC